jgi:3-isopropylmalate dehydratase
MDFGFRAIIAPSFGDIFRNNALQNGMLPIALPIDVCRMLAADAENGHMLAVDLERLEVRRLGTGEAPILFEVDPFRRRCMLKGLDDIELTLEKNGQIEEFEERRGKLWPWLDMFAREGRKITVAPRRSGKTLEW